ncbi:Bgt-3952 [Blumeria graminis f. sp. tritici]|uniref:Bgt-3952 n=2 Tax=Blumeria graminis f. sp. tritici TaxID=62690 RepID=A0A9X9MI34_BLUGR|nr:Diacylglycerol pyrophosphate (DGPP) phosphatase [Blumeria graminis f. sp. tritici 96224]VDB88973.1 Bgt-3952 [Blumeria graminis f. sp. tritici]
MGLFSHRAPQEVDPEMSEAQHTPTYTDKRDSLPLIINMNIKPTFFHWIKLSWLDLLTMLCLGVYFARPAPSRSFPVYFQDGEIIYPQFAYPHRKNIIPIWLAAMLASLIPIALILIMQIRIRSFWDANNAIMGLMYSLITAAVFQVFLKWLIGGLRPHFLTVCQPNISPNAVGSGYQMIMYDRRICTGNDREINDALESFPSGHSTAAFAGFVFLALYLNSKLKVWSDYHPEMWKMVAVWAPILGATLISASLTVDEYHNCIPKSRSAGYKLMRVGYDCVAGAIVGTLMAFSAYRMVYSSIWHYQTNHIPLSRTGPFTRTALELQCTTFTRKAGWGVDHTRPGYSNKEDVTRQMPAASDSLSVLGRPDNSNLMSEIGSV